MIETVTTIRPILSCAPDSTTVLLRYLTQLAGNDNPGPAEGILQDLARHFGARGAGVAWVGSADAAAPGAWIGEDRSADFPWRGQPGQLQNIVEPGRPSVLSNTGGSWLVWCDAGAEKRAPTALWLNDVVVRHWSESEMAAFGLAGQILRRTGLVGAEQSRQGPARTVERLELAAQVTGRLSHDFGNLLTGVLGFTELALARMPTDTLAHRYLTEVWDVARGSAAWLKRLNYFCRGHAPEFTPAGLPGVVAEEEARLRAAGLARWHADVPPDLPPVACDAESLRQALQQVLDNACEATAGRGPVTLSARAVELDDAQAATLVGSPPAGPFVEVVIADCGPGMNADVRRRLFSEMFFSDKPRHRGMGLMITYGIVRRFRGGLRIDAGPAGGTEVRLYLPAAHELVPSGPAHVLVVDDDPQVVAAARRMLEPAGFQVDTTLSPAEALVLHQSATEPFDLILVAVHLPNLAGTDLARRMLLRDPSANFLFLHTPAGPALPRDELLGPDTLLHKPFTPAVLVQAVAAALHRGRRSIANGRVGP
jgi:signal transduction histidine kinase